MSSSTRFVSFSPKKFRCTDMFASDDVASYWLKNAFKPLRGAGFSFNQI